jgi:hypothetical protein
MKPEYPQVQPVRPPVPVSRSPASDLFQLTPDKGALARCTGMVLGCVMKRVIFHVELSLLLIDKPKVSKFLAGIS